MQIKTATAIKIALSGLGFVLLCSLSLFMSGSGNRWGLWDFRTGITVLKWASYGEVSAAVLSLFSFIVGLLARSKTALRISVASILISLGALIMPFNMWSAVRFLPPIHDISTDTENPPQFDKILKLRQGSPNPAEYGGPEVADKQHQAYPEIKPLVLGVQADQAFAKALTVAKKMGWEIVSSDSKTLVIEATATTFWFGFKDDVVIRITPQGFGSRIDVRSVSRIGKSDIGTNAKRIMEFIKNLRTETS